MSRNKSWMAAAYSTIIAMVITLTGVIFAQPSFAADPIAPTQLDRCGIEQDQYVIPATSSGDVYYRGSTYLAPATYTVEPGTSSVTIISYGMTNGSWTFDYVNSAACGSEATNAMAVNIRPCNPATGLSEVFVTYTNVADATTWYDSDVYVEAYMKERGRVEISYVMDAWLLDGQSVTYDLADPDPSYDNGVEGLTPGTYVFTARHSRGGVTTFQARIESCNSTYEFPGTPPVTPGDVLTGKATARIVPGKLVTHTACMDTRKMTGKTKVKFRVERKVGKKFKVIKRASVATGSKDCYKVKAKRGSLLFVMVLNPDNGKWVRVARKKIKR